MDHKSYQTPRDSLNGQHEATTEGQQNCLPTSLSCKATSEFLGLFLGWLAWVLGGLLEWDEAPVNQQSEGRLGEVFISDSLPPFKPMIYTKELDVGTGL